MDSNKAWEAAQQAEDLKQKIEAGLTDLIEELSDLDLENIAGGTQERSFDCGGGSQP